MKIIFKILIGSCFGILGLSLLFFFTQQTLAGRFLVIKTGLSISSVLALIALILFTFSLITYKKIPEEKEERIREAAKTRGMYLSKKAKGRLSSFSQTTTQTLYELSRDLENELGVPHYLIAPIILDEWENIYVSRFQRNLKSIISYIPKK
jgi:hypothetical protein